jgi:hypothetical protein
MSTNETAKRIAVAITSVVILSCFMTVLNRPSLQDSQKVSSHGRVSNQTILPPDGLCYHSAFVNLDPDNLPSTFTDVATAINYFVDLTGKGIFLYNDQATLMLGEPLWMCMPSSSGDCAPLIKKGLIHGIMVGFWPTVRNSSSGQAEDSDIVTVQQIAQGTWDSYIKSLADEAKAFGYLIFLRVGSEMNINQGTLTDQASFGKNATAFVGAWQRVVDIFRSEGATNVMFVWNPNWDDAGPNHWTAYYPGDSYVDWVGIDLYQYWSESDPNGMLQIYNDYSSQKPVMICEWGANYTDQSRTAFVNRFFDAVEARPDIKMISYQYIPPFSFNSTSLPLTTSAYVNRISNSRYKAQPVNG